MTTQIKQYNKALGYIGTERLDPLLGLTEDRPARYELDAVWADSLQYMLQQGGWIFALQSAELLPDGDISPTFGPKRVYTKPADFVRLAGIAIDGYFINELRDYQVDAVNWYSDVNIIYIKYVSNSTSKGLDLNNWPVHFCEAHAQYLAYLSGLPITRDKSDRNSLYAGHLRSLAVSKRLDALDESVKRKPQGILTASRYASRVNGTRRGL